MKVIEVYIMSKTRNRSLHRERVRNIVLEAFRDLHSGTAQELSIYILRNRLSDNITCVNSNAISVACKTLIREGIIKKDGIKKNPRGFRTTATNYKYIIG